MIAMRKETERPKTWRYTTTLDDQVRFLLAPNLEHAAWAAAELSGGSCNVKNIILDDYEVKNPIYRTTGNNGKKFLMNFFMHQHLKSLLIGS